MEIFVIQLEWLSKGSCGNAHVESCAEKFQLPHINRSLSPTYKWQICKERKAFQKLSTMKINVWQHSDFSMVGYFNDTVLAFKIIRLYLFGTEMCVVNLMRESTLFGRLQCQWVLVF